MARVPFVVARKKPPVPPWLLTVQASSSQGPGLGPAVTFPSGPRTKDRVGHPGGRQAGLEDAISLFSVHGINYCSFKKKRK